MNKDSHIEGDAEIGSALKIIAPLLQASMQGTKNITDSLMVCNIQSAFRDGFNAGLIEGRKRKAIETREFLGIWQEEFSFNEAEHYLKQMIRVGEYPYTLLSPEGVRK